MRVFLIAIAGLAVAACATTSEDGDMANARTEPAQVVAAEPERAPAETETASNDDPNRMICRAERVTGQLRRERICRTAAEWDAIREAGRDSIAHRQTTGYQDSPQ